MPRKDDFKSDLIDRLLMCSSEEKAMLLNFEMEKLEEQRRAVTQQLQNLRLLNLAAEDQKSYLIRPEPVSSTVPPLPTHLHHQAGALMNFSMLGQMQLRRQMLASGM